ncbi:MAG: TonB family protein [Acidobacteriota bacterium]
MKANRAFVRAFGLLLCSDKDGWAMTAAAIRSDWTGRVIEGRFTLLKWLGGSDRSGVFLTELSGPGSQVAAIKLIAVDPLEAEAILAGWELTANLSHPHLMHLLHTGRCETEINGLVYSVTELAEEALSEIIPERPLSPREAQEMLTPVLDALFYLHGRGFVHGHLKPSNIMVVGNQLKISGDGLEVMGEVHKQFGPLSIYDAPEVASKEISSPADVWSLGITLVEALTQHPPAWDRSANREPIVPESIAQPFAGLAQCCLQVDPALRYTLDDVNQARSQPARSLPNLAGNFDKTGTVPARFRGTAFIATVIAVFAAIAVLCLRSHRTLPSLRDVRQHPVTTAIPTPRPATPETPPRSVLPGTQTEGAMNREVVKRVLPDVPRSASRTIRGTVRVRVRITVDPNGDVSNATLDSLGPSRYFANLALQAAQEWKFKPAQVDGQLVRRVWILQFDFRQTGTEVTQVETSP